jgi:hypothetical protein
MMEGKMRTVIGVFQTYEKAQRAVEDLKRVISSAERVKLLSPEYDRLRFDTTHVTDSVNRRGFGIAIGAVVGGAIALAVAAILVGGLFPEVLYNSFIGPVVALGVIGLSLLGAWVGTRALDPSGKTYLQGIPQEDYFYYQDALDHNKYVVLASTLTERRAEQIEKLFLQLGAAAHDNVRESWWTGMRATESEFFSDNEVIYRQGFEAALHPEFTGEAFTTAQPALAERYHESINHEAFRRGYERGQQYAARQHLHRAA